MKFSPYGNPIPLCVHPCRVFLYALYNSWGGKKRPIISTSAHSQCEWLLQIRKCDFICSNSAILLRNLTWFERSNQTDRQARLSNGKN